jgi:hypothetical protein
MIERVMMMKLIIVWILKIMKMSRNIKIDISQIQVKEEIILGIFIINN